MAGMKGMYQGPKVVPWQEVEKQYSWFQGYRAEIAKYGFGPGHRMADGAFDKPLSIDRSFGNRQLAL